MENKELTLEEKIKIAKREYMARWRKEHKELVEASQKRYWKKKYEQLKA